MWERATQCLTHAQYAFQSLEVHGHAVGGLEIGQVARPRLLELLDRHRGRLGQADEQVEGDRQVEHAERALQRHLRASRSRKGDAEFE